MWRERIRKFFGIETPEEKAKRAYDVRYQAGVSIVDVARTTLRADGKMQYGIPKWKVLDLWGQVSFEETRNPAFAYGVEARLLELGYADPRVSLETVLDQISAVGKPLSSAQRNVLFYRLVARVDSLSMDEFIREFRYVFRKAVGDTKDYEATVQQMMYDEAWISGQKHDFNQRYSLFANKQPRTMEAFLANGNTVNK